MTARVCLIRPGAPELLNDRIDPPLGLVSLATSIRAAGHEVEIIDFAGGASPPIHPADLYGLTLFTTSMPEALKIRDIIRGSSDAPIMVGGPHAQALPYLTSQEFDYVIVGEAEIELPHLISRLADRSYPQRIVHMHAPQDLGQLPLNDYSPVDLNSYHRLVDGKPAFSIMTGRGCHYRCAYCYTAAQIGGVRLRPVDHVMEELYRIDRQYGVSALRFIDDNFLASDSFFRKLAPRLREFGRPYRIYCRATDLTRERCKLLTWSGCRMVACGIESGSQIMHTRMRTGKCVDHMQQGVKAAHYAGIHIRAGLMIGFPGENWQTVQQSIKVLKTLPIDSYNLFNFIPLPGTDPYLNPKKYGIRWISNNWKDFYILYGDNKASYAFEHDKLDRRTLAEMRAYMISELDQVCRPAKLEKAFV